MMGLLATFLQCFRKKATWAQEISLPGESWKQTLCLWFPCSLVGDPTVTTTQRNTEKQTNETPQVLAVAFPENTPGPQVHLKKGAALDLCIGIVIGNAAGWVVVQRICSKAQEHLNHPSIIPVWHNFKILRGVLLRKMLQLLLWGWETVCGFVELVVFSLGLCFWFSDGLLPVVFSSISDFNLLICPTFQHFGPWSAYFVWMAALRGSMFFIFERHWYFLHFEAWCLQSAWDLQPAWKSTLSFYAVFESMCRVFDFFVRRSQWLFLLMMILMMLLLVVLLLLAVDADIEYVIIVGAVVGAVDVDTSWYGRYFVIFVLVIVVPVVVVDVVSVWWLKISGTPPWTRRNEEGKSRKTDKKRSWKAKKKRQRRSREAEIQKRNTNYKKINSGAIPNNLTVSSVSFHYPSYLFTVLAAHRLLSIICTRTFRNPTSASAPELSEPDLGICTGTFCTRTVRNLTEVSALEPSAPELPEPHRGNCTGTLCANSFCTGTFWNLTLLSTPKPSGTEPSETWPQYLHRNRPQRYSAMESSGTSPGLCTGTLRNLTYALHQNLPEPNLSICTGTCRNLISVSAPEPSATLRNLARNLVLKLHRIAPELILAKDPAKCCCWGKRHTKIIRKNGSPLECRVVCMETPWKPPPRCFFDATCNGYVQRSKRIPCLRTCYVLKKMVPPSKVEIYNLQFTSWWKRYRF